jgi:NAD(P)-dependent dehydrogenase (short-subunit alcohol dehydrogenase family)
MSHETKGAQVSGFDPFGDFRMHDHVAIVTGGAQNIGAAIARSFAGAGARVVIADLDADKAKTTADPMYRSCVYTRSGLALLGASTSDVDLEFLCSVSEPGVADVVANMRVNGVERVAELDWSGWPVWRR